MALVNRLGAFVAAFAVFLALFPFSGVDTQPPRHYSVFGNRVPTDQPWLAAVVGAVVLAVLWWVVTRHRRTTAQGPAT